MVMDLHRYQLPHKGFFFSTLSLPLDLISQDLPTDHRFQTSKIWHLLSSTGNHFDHHHPPFVCPIALESFGFLPFLALHALVAKVALISFGEFTVLELVSFKPG